MAKKYQNFTEADILRLRNAGFTQPFTSLEKGIDTFMQTEKKRMGIPEEEGVQGNHAG